MGNVIGNLTQGELVMVLGRLLVKVGEKMHAGEFSDEDGASLSEILDLTGSLASDVLAEYQDTD
jgi:hypothetical protein